MAEDYRLSKVGILFQQKKFIEAENILKELLSEDPNDVEILSYLAEVNIKIDKYDFANTIVDQAIGLSPDNSNLFYLKSRIEIQKENFNEAEIYIYQAIKLEPYDADYLALLANICLERKQFEESLKNANLSLEIDPENLLALNTRSTVLNKLNMSDEAFQTIEGALREDPNNAYTHANYGWSLLENGNHKKAMEHFKEALINDPNYSYAQSGLSESLKATNLIYRLFLKYSFWIGNLSKKYQWGIIIGILIIYNTLLSISKNNEALKPYLLPIIIILALLAFSSWFIYPLSNLFLRFNKFGKFLLNKSEILSSNLIAICLIISVFGMTLSLILSNEIYLIFSIYGLGMIVPISKYFIFAKYKKSILIYLISMALVGIWAIVHAFTIDILFNLMTLIFIFAFVGFQWFATYLFIKENNA